MEAPKPKQKKQLLLMELLPKQANQIWKALQYFPFWSYSPPFKKVKSQIVFRKFQQTGDQTGHWVWSVGNPSNPSLAAHIEGFPLVLLTSEKVVCASAFFYAAPVKHPNFLARTDPTQRDHKSPTSWGNSGYLPFPGQWSFGGLVGCFLASGPDFRFRASRTR